MSEHTLTFDYYQEAARKFAIYPRLYGLIYPALGLGGEAGEVLEIIKKMIRDDDLKLTSERKDKLEKEMGDVLWYLAALAGDAGLNLSEIARKNIVKLQSRQDRGVIKGSGDDR